MLKSFSIFSLPTAFISQFPERHFRSLTLIILCASAILFLSSCTHNAQKEQQLKTLDSLSGALNQKIIELRQVDTLTLGKALTKFDNYRKFIGQNVHDTLTKDEGDHLQQFYSSGQNLESFGENRRMILARGSLINSQLNKLMLDTKEGGMEFEKLREYVSIEKANTELLIKASVEQQQMFQSSLQEFKLSISGVEQLIKARNNGQMPTVIKDSIPL